MLIEYEIDDSLEQLPRRVLVPDNVCVATAMAIFRACEVDTLIEEIQREG